MARTIPRVLLPDRVEWLPQAGDTPLGPSFTAPGSGTILPGRVRPGERAARRSNGDTFVAAADVVLDTEVPVGDLLVLNYGAGQVLRVEKLKARMDRVGPIGWTATCSEYEAVTPGD